MVTKWLHLNDMGGDPWVLPIWGAVHKAIEAKKVAAISKELSELGVHVSARLNLLPRVVNRLNTETKELHKATASHKLEHVCSDTIRGAALSVDDDLKYRLIADIDAFLFEVNSCAELMGRFFQLLHAHAGSPIDDKKLSGALRDALAKFEVDGGWFRLLDRNRNFVAHQGTPYLAIDVSDDVKWELLITKENLTNFDEPEKFFRLAELQAISDGFSSAKVALQKYLMELFK
jgi:hypothetical protein